MPANKHFFIFGGFLCAIGIIWSANAVNHSLPMTIFFMGWYIGLIGILKYAFSLKNVSLVVIPIKLFAVGFTIVSLGLPYKMITNESTTLFFYTGSTLISFAVAWWVVSLVRKNL